MKSSKPDPLKKIEAIVRKERFPGIDAALKAAGIAGLTFVEAEGRGRGKGREMLSDRGTRVYRPEYVDRIKLEIIVKDTDAPRVIDVIMKNAKTGAVGDGKIMVVPLDEAYDIAGGERGEKAI